MVQWITVNDMYNYAKTNDLKLLSSYGDEFWQDYITNSTRYDMLFKRYYKNFRYFDQDIMDDTTTVESVTKAFIDEVYNHLLINKKKYAELYRIANLSDSDYDYMSNLDMTETVTGSGTDNRTYVSGSRSDSTSDMEGARTDTSEEQVSAFNESTYTNANKTTDEKGSETDTSTFSKGEQTDTDNTTSTDSRTIDRKGLLSRDSKSELIKKHINLWDGYKFYEYIFNQIAKELLLI